jgi:hypothetical protein
MSGLGRVPSFEPDEEAKAMIESMFAEKKKDVVTDNKETFDKEIEEIDKPKTNITPGKRHRVKIPDPPKQTKEQEELAIKLAKEEMDIIHEAFMEFSEKTSDTVIYGYLYQEILKLVESFEDVDVMIQDNFNEDDITGNGEPYYEKMKQIRARILNDVYGRYKEGK